MNATKTLTHSAPTTKPNTETQSRGLLSPPDSQRDDLKAQLAEEIHSRLNGLPENTDATKEDVVNAYRQSLEKLQRMGDDLQQMIPPLCKANLVYRQVGPDASMTTRQDALNEAHHEMVDGTVFKIPRPRVEIDAEVLSAEPNDLVALLRDSIDRNVRGFVDAFFDSLDDLVDESVAGLAFWRSPTTVQYSFVRQIVEQNVAAEETEVQRRETDSSRVVIETKTTSVSGTNTYLFARHEHHVFDACKTTIENSNAVIPVAVQAYISKVPDWLLPIHRIIDGKLAHKQVVEKRYRTEEWDETVAVDVFVYGRDPALVIGDVVLIGWDADDIRQEETRRRNITSAEQQAEEKRKAEQLAPLWGLLTAALAFLSLYLFWQPTSAVQLWVACATLLVTTVPCVLATEYSNKASSEKAESIMTSLGLFSVLLGIGLFLAFRLTLWSAIGTSAYLIVTGIGLVGASLAATRQSPQQFSLTECIALALGSSLLLGAILYFIVGQSLVDAIDRKPAPAVNVATEPQTSVSQEMQNDS